MNPHDWLDEHGDALYRFAMQLSGDEDIAADLVQETLLSAWKGKASYAGKSSVRTWLIGILKHKWIDHLRKEIRRRAHVEESKEDPTAWFDPAHGSWLNPPGAWRDDPASLCQDAQFLQVLDTCVGKLPEKQRLVFDMREFQGLDSADICHVCDVSTTHVHVLLHRARLALRHCLETHWFGGKKPWEG